MATGDRECQLLTFATCVITDHGVARTARLLQGNRVETGYAQMNCRNFQSMAADNKEGLSHGRLPRPDVCASFCTGGCEARIQCDADVSAFDVTVLPLIIDAIRVQRRSRCQKHYAAACPTKCPAVLH
jgi:hypothetical protein